jgi:hypothetical protein
LYAKTEHGCTASVNDAGTVKVNPLPTITLSGTNPQTVDAEDAIGFIAFTASCEDPNWTVSELPYELEYDDYADETIYLYGGIMNAGTYTISVNAEDAIGCKSNTLDAVFYVLALPDFESCNLQDGKYWKSWSVSRSWDDAVADCESNLGWRLPTVTEFACLYPQRRYNLSQQSYWVKNGESACIYLTDTAGELAGWTSVGSTGPIKNRYACVLPY